MCFCNIHSQLHKIITYDSLPVCSTAVYTGSWPFLQKNEIKCMHNYGLFTFLSFQCHICSMETDHLRDPRHSPWMRRDCRGEGWALFYRRFASCCSPWTPPSHRPLSAPRTIPPRTRPRELPTMTSFSMIIEGRVAWTTVASCTSSGNASSPATRTARACARRTDPFVTNPSALKYTQSAPRWNTTAVAPSAKRSKTSVNIEGKRIKSWRNSR